MKTSTIRLKTAAVGLAFLAVSVLTACSGSTTSDGKPTKAEIEVLFDQWESTLHTGDLVKVAALYSDNAVLLPTISDRTRDSRAKIEDYFVKFLSYQPKGTIDSESVQVLDNDAAVNNGTYTFVLLKDGKLESVKARFTFVYDKNQAKWLITTHHSSVLPAP